MAQQQEAKRPAEVPAASLEKAVVVKVKPASSSEKGILFELPAELGKSSISDIVNYALNQGDSRKNERIADRVKQELAGNEGYGITVNGQVVGQNDGIAGYLVERDLDGTKYDELEIIVAAKQEGGYRI